MSLARAEMSPRTDEYGYPAYFATNQDIHFDPSTARTEDAKVALIIDANPDAPPPMLKISGGSKSKSIHIIKEEKHSESNVAFMAEHDTSHQVRSPPQADFYNDAQCGNTEPLSNTVESSQNSTSSSKPKSVSFHIESDSSDSSSDGEDEPQWQDRRKLTAAEKRALRKANKKEVKQQNRDRRAGMPGTSDGRRTKERRRRKALREASRREREAIASETANNDSLC